MPFTVQELELIHAIGFDEAMCSEIKAIAGKPLERLGGTGTAGQSEPASGLSIGVADGEDAERLMNALRSILGPAGCRSFWSRRHAPDGISEGDELAILKTLDPYAMVRLCRTNGGNYGVSTDDILSRLAAWEQICAFDVVGASRDWVALQFSRLPDNICAFAEEVHDFCPDTVVQGVGLLREKDDPERFRLARALCPDVSENVNRRSADNLAKVMRIAPAVSGTFQDLFQRAREERMMGVRLLAHDMQTRGYLFLWWD